MTTFIRIKHLCGLLLTATAFALAPASQAATVSISSAGAAAGDTVTVQLSIDDTPLDSGLFTLDIDLAFDPALLTFQVLRDGSLAGGAQFFLATSAPAPVTLSPVSLNIVSSYDTAPGGGTLVELDFLIAAGATPGQSSPLHLSLVDSSTTIGKLVDGAITVVPVPGTALLLASGLAWLGGHSARRKSHAA